MFEYVSEHPFLDSFYTEVIILFLYATGNVIQIFFHAVMLSIQN